MTKVKLCGLSRLNDIKAANQVKPDYIGFVFAPKSKRYVTWEKANQLKRLLSPDIKAVGVFVNEKVENIVAMLNSGTIDIAQLHGDEDDIYISRLRALTDKQIIKAFRVHSSIDIELALASNADYILLDSGAGSGTSFDWSLLKNINRPYFLAGGLDLTNVSLAIKTLNPFAVDVSSGVESCGIKDIEKMAAFVAAVRKESI